MAYGQLKSEAELGTIPHDKAPPLEWPDKGTIKLDNAKFKYMVDYPYVLKSISFRIESCEKVITNYVTSCVYIHYILGWYCG